MKLGDITREVVEKVVSLCPDCGFTDDSIGKLSFSCYPNTLSFVTYRARFEGTSQTDSDHFISLIEQWVSDGASVIVTGVLMKVDSKCLVEISDLSEDKCIMKPVFIAPTPVSRPTTLVTTESTPSGQDDPQSLTIILTVIGVIMIVLGVIIAITATIIAVLVSRNHRAEYALKSSEKMCVKIILTVIKCAMFASFVHRSGSVEAEGSAIQTTSNEAYEKMKQGGGGGRGEAYEMMDVTPIVTTPNKIGSTSAADMEGMYETPSASSQPLPAVPPPPETNEKEEEDGVYEVIPGDK